MVTATPGFSRLLTTEVPRASTAPAAHCERYAPPAVAASVWLSGVTLPVTTGASPSGLLLLRNGRTKSDDGSTEAGAEPDCPTIELWVALSQPTTWAFVGSRADAETENS